MRKGANPPKNWQFENFSYVIVRRGPRPPSPADVFIEPRFQEFEEDLLQYVNIPPQILEAMKEHAASLSAAGVEGGSTGGLLRPEDVFPFLSEPAPAAAAAAAEAKQDAALDTAVKAESQSAGQGAESWPEAAVFLDEYLASLEHMPLHSDGARSLRLRMQYAGVIPGAVVPLSHEGTMGGREAPPAVRPATEDCPGPENNVADDGVANGGASQLPFMHIGRAGDLEAARTAQLPSRQALPPPKEEELWLRGRNWVRQDGTGVERARRAAANWSRLVRRPLKRGRHVVLDLCVAAPGGRSGDLERHIVAHSDRLRPWLGPAAYRLARHSRWGDLWPSVYHKNFRVRRWQ
jgi:hypothetical protein